MENAFTLLPMSQNFTLDPGETYTGTITIVNPVDSKSDFAYSVSVSPYSVVGEDYQADISNRLFTSRNIARRDINEIEPMFLQFVPRADLDDRTDLQVIRSTAAGHEDL